MYMFGYSISKDYAALNGMGWLTLETEAVTVSVGTSPIREP